MIEVGNEVLFSSLPFLFCYANMSDKIVWLLASVCFAIIALPAMLIL